MKFKLPVNSLGPGCFVLLISKEVKDSFYLYHPKFFTSSFRCGVGFKGKPHAEKQEKYAWGLPSKSILDPYPNIQSDRQGMMMRVCTSQNHCEPHFFQHSEDTLLRETPCPHVDEEKDLFTTSLLSGCGGCVGGWLMAI